MAMSGRVIAFKDDLSISTLPDGSVLVVTDHALGASYRRTGHRTIWVTYEGRPPETVDAEELRAFHPQVYEAMKFAHDADLVVAGSPGRVHAVVDTDCCVTYRFREGDYVEEIHHGSRRRIRPMS